MDAERRALELKLEMARRGVFVDDAGQPSQVPSAPPPASFDPAFESKRASKLSGLNVEGYARPLVRQGNVNPQLLGATRDAVSEFDRRQGIAESGVELNTPLPVSSASMGFTNDQARAVQTELTKHFGEKGVLDARKVQMRIGPKSGVLEYQDPETNTYHIVNPDILSKAGYALPIGGDITGTLIGGTTGLLRGGPAGKLIGETFGSATGTGAGEVLRLYVGKVMGWNDMTNEEIMNSGIAEGGLAGVITLGTGGAIVSTQALRNYIKGGGFSREAAIEAGFSDHAADELVAEIRKILYRGGSKKTFSPTTAQRSVAAGGDYASSIGGVESKLRSHLKYAQDFIDLDTANKAGLKDVMDITTAKFTGPNQPIDMVSDTIRAKVTKRAKAAKKLFDEKVLTFRESLRSMDSMFPESAGKDIRPVLEAKRKLAEDAYQDSYNTYKTLAGFNEDTGLTGIILKVPTKLKRLKARFEAADKRHMVGASSGKSKVITAKDEAYDLADWNQALSDMKAEVRVAQAGQRYGVAPKGDIGKTKLAIRKMEAARNQALIDAGRGDVLDALLKAEMDRKLYSDIFERSFVGDVLQFDGLSYKLRNDRILGQIMTQSPEDLDILYHVINGNPQAMQAIRKGIAGLYKKQVVGTTGKLKAGAHELWMDSNQDVLNKFFTKAERRSINSLDDMNNIILKHEKKLDVFLKNAEKTWGRGALVDRDPEKMVDFIFSNSSIIRKPSGEQLAMPLKKVRWLKSVLKDDPAAMSAIRANYAERISNAVFTDGKFTPKALDDLLKNEDVVRSLMGGEYVNNMKTLRNGLKMIDNRFPQLHGDDWKDAFVQALRGTDFAAPLSKPGRRVTALLLLSRRQNLRIVKDALMNPDKLDTIATVLKHNGPARRTAELAASIGVILPYNEVMEPQVWSMQNSYSR